MDDEIETIIARILAAPVDALRGQVTLNADDVKALIEYITDLETLLEPDLL